MTAGIRHTFNFFKFRILGVLYEAYMDQSRSNYVTTKELAAALYVTPTAFHNILPKARAYGMITRNAKRKLNRETNDKSYRWRITKYGIQVYLGYRARIAEGKSLNRKHVGKHVESYLYIDPKSDIDPEAVAQIEEVLIGDIRPAVAQLEAESLQNKLNVEATLTAANEKVTSL